MKRAFIFDKNRVFAPVQVGRVHGYAHVDTGVRSSSVLQTYVDKLPVTDSRVHSGASGSAPVRQVCLDEIEFLGETIGDLLVDVQPDAVGGLDRLPFKVIMALGCDVLLHKPLFMNFMAHEMTFLNDLGPITEAIVQLETDFSSNLPIFEISLGCYKLKAIFDTGETMCALNQSQLEKLRSEVCEEDTLERVDAAGTRSTAPTFMCRCLGVAGYSLGKCQFVVIDFDASAPQPSQEIDFVFGVNAIKRRCWVMKSQRGFIEVR